MRKFLERWPQKMNDLLKRALAHGFSHASTLCAEVLRPRAEVRDMCRADKCRHYDRSWMCPPACGSLVENERRIREYASGLIVQTTGELDDDFDYESMAETERRQERLFAAFNRALKLEYPRVLALGSGCCELCAECAYPGVPCRHPDDATQSMEAFGLVVSDVCRENGLGYYYGPKTITFTGCYLLK
jgi:predicted metal-binding protein